MAGLNHPVPTLGASILRSAKEVRDMRLAADRARHQAMMNMACGPSALSAVAHCRNDEQLRQVRALYGIAVADPRMSVRLVSISDVPAPSPAVPVRQRLATRNAVIGKVGFGGGGRARA